MIHATEQENFWAGEFGTEYIGRSSGDQLFWNNLHLFGKIIRSAPGIRSVIELGCNIGINLQVLQKIDARFDLAGYEINPVAAGIAAKLGVADIVCDTIVKPLPVDKTYDLSFTKGVLIHTDPAHLHAVYRNLVDLSNRYIMICEFYNPTPVMVNYRGYDDKLIKRDFAGELIDQFNLRLVDYGFQYHRDNYFPNTDFTWFLLEK